jgi:hypothetical protein
MCGETGGEPSCHFGVRDRGNDRFDARNFQFLAAGPFPSATRGPAKLDDLIVSDDKGETTPFVSPPVLPLADRLPYPFLAKFAIEPLVGIKQPFFNARALEDGHHGASIALRKVIRPSFC